MLKRDVSGELQMKLDKRRATKEENFESKPQISKADASHSSDHGAAHPRERRRTHGGRGHNGGGGLLFGMCQEIDCVGPEGDPNEFRVGAEYASSSSSSGVPRTSLPGKLPRERTEQFRHGAVFTRPNREDCTARPSMDSNRLPLGRRVREQFPADYVHGELRKRMDPPPSASAEEGGSRGDRQRNEKRPAERPVQEPDAKYEPVKVLLPDEIALPSDKVLETFAKQGGKDVYEPVRAERYDRKMYDRNCMSMKYEGCTMGAIDDFGVGDALCPGASYVQPGLLAHANADDNNSSSSSSSNAAAAAPRRAFW